MKKADDHLLGLVLGRDRLQLLGDAQLAFGERFSTRETHPRWSAVNQPPELAPAQALQGLPLPITEISLRQTLARDNFKVLGLCKRSGGFQGAFERAGIN